MFKKIALPVIGILLALSIVFGASSVLASEGNPPADDWMEDGDFPDWIELFNSGNESINLEEYKISDDTLVLDKWAFPSIELEPDAFLVIFASGKDRYDPAELHSFRK